MFWMKSYSQSKTTIHLHAHLFWMHYNIATGYLNTIPFPFSPFTIAFHPPFYAVARFVSFISWLQITAFNFNGFSFNRCQCKLYSININNVLFASACEMIARQNGMARRVCVLMLMVWAYLMQFTWKREQRQWKHQAKNLCVLLRWAHIKQQIMDFDIAFSFDFHQIWKALINNKHKIFEIINVPFLTSPIHFGSLFVCLSHFRFVSLRF